MADQKPEIAKRQKAVALEQMGDRLDVPKITAVGEGANAEKILRLAFDNDVKVRRDEELVELLAKFDVDDLIPVEALGVVSEILSHVYRENIELEKFRHPDFNKNESWD